MEIIVGVGLLLFAKINGDLKLFTIKELKDKPTIYKKAGMKTFPFPLTFFYWHLFLLNLITSYRLIFIINILANFNQRIINVIFPFPRIAL